MLLYQPQDGYCYNSDSLFLYDFINHFHPKGDVLDVGAGCGVLGLLIARDNPKIHLDAVEKQDIFIHYASTNARVNKINYTLHHMDFLDLPIEKKYDFIISNPPFYPDKMQKTNNEIISTARYNNNLPLQSFFKKVSQLLKPQAHFIFCYDPTQLGMVCNALEKAKLKIVDLQFVHPKVEKKASLVMIHTRNGSKSMMNVWPPFIAFEGDNPSKKAQEIYKKSSTQSIKCHI